MTIGEMPQVLIYRDKRSTFIRLVAIAFIAAVLIMTLVRGQTTVAALFHGARVVMPIMVMGLAVRQHFGELHGRTRTWGAWEPTGGIRIGALGSGFARGVPHAGANPSHRV